MNYYEYQSGNEYQAGTTGTLVIKSKPYPFSGYAVVRQLNPIQ